MVDKFDSLLNHCYADLCDAQLSLCEYIDGKGYVCPQELKHLYDRISNIIDDIDSILDPVVELISEL